jgi:hypothetical protein
MDMRGGIKQIFELGFEDFRKEHPEKVSEWVVETVTTMIACRTERLGCHLMRCGGSVGQMQCEKLRFVPHSCKQKICSSCGKIANDNWLAKMQEITLPIVHHHITFTVPKQLRPLIAGNYQILLSAMYETSAKAVMVFAKKHGFKPGILSCSQTYGTELNFNPHIHMAVTTGGIGIWKKGKKKRKQKQNVGEWVPYDDFKATVISEIWVAIFLKKLRRLYQQQKLVIPWTEKELMKDYGKFTRFLATLVPRGMFSSMNKKGWKGWSVFVSERKTMDPSPLGYIGRYIRTPPISEKRITAVADAVSFFVKDYHHEKEEGASSFPVFSGMNIVNWVKNPKYAWKKTKLLQLELLEMVGRLISHIPPRGFKIPRSYGLYANRCKAERIEMLTKIPEKYIIPKEIMEKWEKKKTSWRERQTEKHGADPFLCDCGKEMKFDREIPGNHPVWKKYSMKDLAAMKASEALSAIAKAEDEAGWHTG